METCAGAWFMCVRACASCRLQQAGEVNYFCLPPASSAGLALYLCDVYMTLTYVMVWMGPMCAVEIVHTK